MNYLAALAAGDGDGRRPTLTRTEEWREDEQLDDLIPAHAKIGPAWPAPRYRPTLFPRVPQVQTPEDIGLYGPNFVTFYLMGHLLGPWLLQVAIEQTRT